MKRCLLLLLSYFYFQQVSYCQHDHKHHETVPNAITDIEPQPLLAQAVRLKEALAFLGSYLTPADERKINALQHGRLTPDVAKRLQDILDPYCLAIVNI